jgi:nucleoside-diphosphate-sugar epimerase
MKIIVTGGCGYVGSILVKKLIKNHFVRVIDNQWFGNYLPENKNLEIIKADIRDISKDENFKGYDAIIHLANIANDPSVDLDPSLSWEVNVLAAKKLIEISIKNNLKKFIYASSGSVYGIKDELNVTEDLDLFPISTYNKTKMICERLLLSYKDKIELFIVRPATVCGFSPRMRFDVSVNMLTLQALKKKKLTIFGGKQIRPAIHIDDMVSLYEHCLFSNIETGIYNAGFENISILDLGKKIQKIINCEIEIKKDVNDPRSYRLSSKKLLDTGFKKKFSVEDAILQLKKLYEENKLVENDSCYTVKWMKRILHVDRN